MEILNRKARYDYEIEDTYEAGIVLTGTEIKSIREGKVKIVGGQLPPAINNIKPVKEVKKEKPVEIKKEKIEVITPVVEDKKQPKIATIIKKKEEPKIEPKKEVKTELKKEPKEEPVKAGE